MFQPFGGSGVRMSAVAAEALIRAYEARAARLVKSPRGGRRVSWKRLMQERAMALAAALARRIRWAEVRESFAPPGRARVEDMRLLTLGAPVPEWQRGEAPEVVIIAMLTGLARVWRGLEYSFPHAGQLRLQRRRLSRQGRGYPAEERLVMMRVAGPGVAALLPFLAMGETAHAGRKATLGLGRFAWEMDEGW